MRRWSLIRAILLFFFGMGVAAYEVTQVHPVDLPALGFAAAAMGLPWVLHQDEKAQQEPKQ